MHSKADNRIANIYLSDLYDHKKEDDNKGCTHKAINCLKLIFRKLLQFSVASNSLLHELLILKLR